ncbi:MAG: hypothetical protein ACOCRO_03930 [Halanaerobiales bacterium]
MNISNDFSDLKAIANEPIYLYIEDYGEYNDTFSFQINPLTVRDVFFNEDIIFFINIVDRDISELNDMIYKMEIKSHFQFIYFI